MKVSDVMTPAVVVDVADDTLADAAAKMREQQTGSLLIMDGERLVGIFTERDLLKSVGRGQDPKNTSLKDVMATDLITIPPDVTLHDAAALMTSKWIRHLPVVEGEKVVGVLSQRDLVGVFAQVLDEPETIEQVRGEELARAKRLKRIQAGDLD